MVIPKIIMYRIHQGHTLRVYRNDFSGPKTYIADFQHAGEPESKTSRSPQAAVNSLAIIIKPKSK